MSETQTATAQVIGERTLPTSVTDSRGRVLKLRKLGALQKLRLFKACGAQASVGPYLGMAMLAAAVEQIDDVPAPQPANEQQIEALISKLGDEGLDAVGKAFAQEDEADALTLDAAKN